MFRFCNLGTWYGTEIEDVEDDMSNIQEFINSGTAVVLAADVEDFKELLNLEDEDFTVV